MKKFFIFAIFALLAPSYAWEQTETKTAIKTKKSGVAVSAATEANAKAKACEEAKKKAAKADCGWFKGDIVDLKPSNECSCSMIDKDWRCEAKYEYACLKDSVKTKKSDVASASVRERNTQVDACERAKSQAKREASCAASEGRRTQIKVNDNCHCQNTNIWECRVAYNYTCTKDKERENKKKSHKK